MRRKPDSALVARAEDIRLSAPAIEAFAEELPREPKEIERLLDECIEGCHGRAFTVVSLAALHAGIPVEARFLIEGARLLPNPGYLARLSVHMTGDVTAALLSAVADGRLSWEKEAVAICLASERLREEGGDRYRREIVRAARMQARKPAGLAARFFILEASAILKDEELFLLAPSSERLDALAGPMTEALVELSREPVLSNLEEDEEEAEPLAPRRRAVPRVGRNDPCHCGSGKKYKRCCAEKDEQRLRDSSDVAGLTRTELRHHLEEHLTIDRIHSLKAYELARLDPALIAPELLPVLLNRLVVFAEFGAIRDLFAALGTDGLEGHWLDAIDGALAAGKKDHARALLALGTERKEEWLSFPARFLVEGIEEVRALDILEEEAKRSIDEAPVGLAIDLLRSRWPHLGIHVARGAVPLASPLDRPTVLEELGLARDRLDLSAVDPIEDFEDPWEWDDDFEDLARGTAEEREPQQPIDDRHARDLAAKEAEVARLREELSGLRKKLEADESALRKADEPKETDGRVAELKDRVAALRAELSRRHSERNQLRRQLERTTKELEALNAERSVRESPEDPEEDVAEGAEPVEMLTGFLPLRIPVFSRRFRSSLEKAPEPVRRRAVVVASRIAAGDASALRGACRLQSDRDLYRQRIGREYRLLFRLHDEELDVVELAHRRELERVLGRD
jgi:hypothetical protein